MKSPRRTFATPFVVTVGLTGCSSTTPHDETAPPTLAPAVAPAPTPDAAVTPTPPTLAPRDDKPSATTWTVTMYTKAKICELQYNMDCPPAASCNPPQPRSYKCPSGMTTDRRAFITQLLHEAEWIDDPPAPKSVHDDVDLVFGRHLHGRSIPLENLFRKAVGDLDERDLEMQSGLRDGLANDSLKLRDDDLLTNIHGVAGAIEHDEPANDDEKKKE